MRALRNLALVAALVAIAFVPALGQTMGSDYLWPETFDCLSWPAASSVKYADCDITAATGYTITAVTVRSLGFTEDQAITLAFWAAAADAESTMFCNVVQDTVSTGDTIIAVANPSGLWEYGGHWKKITVGGVGDDEEWEVCTWQEFDR